MERSIVSRLLRALVDGLDSMPDRDRDVLRRRYGLGSGTRETLEEVGRRHNVTRERVRQIQNKALKRLGAQPAVRAPLEQLASSGGDAPPLSYEPVWVLVCENEATASAAHGWTSLIADLCPDVESLRAPSKEASQSFDALVQEHPVGIAYRDEFVARIEGLLSHDRAAAYWESRRQSDPRFYWTESAAIPKNHAALAFHVLSESGEPLHWREIFERACEVAPDRSAAASGLFNAMAAKPDLFARTRPGTYGLRSWGLVPRRRQKDVLATILRREKHTLSRDEMLRRVAAEGADIPRSSVSMYLHMDLMFYEDLDGKYGLREWLPPPQEQRLDTPSWRRESKRSRDSRNRPLTRP